MDTSGREDEERLQSLRTAWEQGILEEEGEDTLQENAMEMVVLMARLGLYDDLRGFVVGLDPSFLPAITASSPEAFFALAEMYLHQDHFTDVYHMIQSSGHLLKGQKEALVQLWDRTLYKETEKITGYQLNPLHRFRLRQRNPPPQYLCPTGSRGTAALPSAATRSLWAWALTHAYRLYPNRTQKEQLVAQTGLTIEQIGTWFSNIRRRSKKVGLRNFFEKKKMKLNLKEEIQYTAPLTRLACPLLVDCGYPSPLRQATLPTTMPPPYCTLPSPLTQATLPTHRPGIHDHMTGEASLKQSLHSKKLPENQCSVAKSAGTKPDVQGDFDIWKWPPSSTDTSLTSNYVPLLTQRVPNVQMPETAPSPLVPDYNPTNQPSFGPLPGLFPLDINSAMPCYNPVMYPSSFGQPLPPSVPPVGPLSPYLTPEHTFCCGPYYGMDYYQGCLEVPRPVTSSTNCCSQAHTNFLNNNFSQALNTSSTSIHYQSQANSSSQTQGYLLNNQLTLDTAAYSHTKENIVPLGPSSGSSLYPTKLTCYPEHSFPPQHMITEDSATEEASQVDSVQREGRLDIGPGKSTDTWPSNRGKSKDLSQTKDPLEIGKSSSGTSQLSLPSLSCVLQAPGPIGKSCAIDENNNDIVCSDAACTELNESTMSSDEAFTNCSEEVVCLSRAQTPDHRPAQLLFPMAKVCGTAGERQVSEKGGILHLSPQDPHKAEGGPPASSTSDVSKEAEPSVFTHIKKVKPQPEPSAASKPKAPQVGSAMPGPLSAGFSVTGEATKGASLAPTTNQPYSASMDSTLAPISSLMPSPPHGPIAPVVSTHFVGPYHTQVWTQTAMMSGLSLPAPYWPPVSAIDTYYGPPHLRCATDVSVSRSVSTPYWPGPPRLYSAITTSSGGSQCSSSPPGSLTSKISSPSQHSTEQDVVEALLNLSHYSL